MTKAQYKLTHKIYLTIFSLTIEMKKALALKDTVCVVCNESQTRIKQWSQISTRPILCEHFRQTQSGAQCERKKK